MLRSSMLRKSAAITSLALALTACAGEADDPQTDDTPTDVESTPDATDTDTDEPMAVHEANGTLELGYILPQTGQLAFLGPPMIGGVEYAVSLINEAGGVLGSEISLSEGDEAGDAAIASQSASRLLGEGVDAIVGAAATGMSLAIIDSVTGAGVVQCSPSNTGATFTSYDDGGWYFRTAPSDALQGPVLAELIANDGNQNVVILNRSDDYGQGLAGTVKDALEAAGATVTGITYDENATTFTAEVGEAINAGPDAVVLISFEEGAQILKEMIEAGAGPDSDVAIYGADGVASNTFWESVDPNNAAVVEGMRGTRPAGETDADFLAALQEFKPDLEDTLFAAEAFDCVNVIALAALEAGTDAGTSFRDAMNTVTKDGEKCTSFQQCADLIAAGTDIDYDGASGALDFTAAGEPGTGIYEKWEFGADGQLQVLEKVTFES